MGPYRAGAAAMMGLVLAGLVPVSQGVRAQGLVERMSPQRTSAALEAEANGSSAGSIWMREMRRSYPEVWAAFKARLGARAAGGTSNAGVQADSAGFQSRFFAAKRASLARSTPAALRDLLGQNTSVLRSLKVGYPDECQRFTTAGSLAPNSRAAQSSTVQFQLSYLQAAFIRAAKAGDLSSRTPAVPLNATEIRAIAANYKQAGGTLAGFENALLGSNTGLSGVQVCEANMLMNDVFRRAPDALVVQHFATPTR